MKKPAIPPVSKSSDAARMRFDSSIKERLEIIGGERSAKFNPLPADASLEQVVARINAIQAILQ